jgi:threonine/homoserine/homoserine lactone efflux protein
VSWEAWIVFAGFWAVFVTTPGPNAVNCINNGMTLGFRRSLPGVAAILTQAALFLTASAAGVTALIAAAPNLLLGMKIAGALVLVWLGLRGWLTAGVPPRVADGVRHRQVYFRALMIATINAKSVAGYLAAFTQFVRADVPVWQQMAWIYPTALTLTALSYCSYTALGAGLGRAALGAVFNIVFRRTLAVAFVIYGAALGASALPGRP